MKDVINLLFNILTKIGDICTLFLPCDKMGFPSFDSLFLFFQARAATIAKTHKAIPPTKIPIPTIDP